MRFMKPYIFLTQNYLSRAVDNDGQAIDIRTIENYPIPFSQTVFFGENGETISAQETDALVISYLSQSVNNNGKLIDIRKIENQQVPFTKTLFLADRYGNIVSQEIDTLIISGTNIVNMTIEYESSGEYSTLFEIQNNNKSDILIQLENPINASSLRFTIPNDTYNPQIVNIGFMGLFKHLINLCALTDGTFENDTNEGSYRLVSGELVHYADFVKWTCKLKIENLPKEQLDIITKQAKETGEISVIPYADLEPAEIYECAVSRELSRSVDRKTELFNLELELKEL